MLGLHDAVWAYMAPMLLFWAVYAATRRATSRRSRRIRDAAIAAGLTEPASLHPLIDPVQCIGCGSCVRACPEHDVLGLIGDKAELIKPTRCIGHGACAAACPAQAITLVFGTETRGVELPVVSAEFETNVPGIYIAGELGGMGLVRNAIEQGRQAIDAITARAERRATSDRLDVVIVGAGPAGFSASLAAMERGLRAVTVEQDTLGGTVAHYPRGKIVMTAPVVLPMVGRVRMRETTKEALLEFWEGVEARTGVRIRYGERVDAVTRDDGGFVVKTVRSTYRTRTVLLAIGRRGTPRKLGVPGEERSKVVYRLVDPEQFRDKHVLVVGGGDSAVEAAVALAGVPGTDVSLSYRSAAFGRIKEGNRERLDTYVAEARLRVLLNSEVLAVDDDRVRVQVDGESTEIENDAVIVCIGGIVPTAFLSSMGIETETKHGTP